MKIFISILLLGFTLTSFGQTSLQHVKKGNARAKLNDNKGAIAEYTKALIIDPTNAEAYFKRGGIKYKLQDFPGAIDDFSKAIEINKTYLDAYVYRATARTETGL